jgi:4-alpha-glucanotransferase
MALSRSSGILLHVSSLPGPFGIGDLGPGAYRFADFLAHTRQQLWQVLPVVPVGHGNSPYSSPSTFAGNPLFICPTLLAEQHLLTDEALARAPAFPAGEVDFERVIPFKRWLLGLAFDRFDAGASAVDPDAFDRFCRANAFWLDDYALFMALKAAYDDAPWTDWPTGLAFRQPEALTQAQAEHAREIRRHMFWQFLFETQWHRLKHYCNARAIRLFGDLPIYVAHDSADVWAHPDLFFLDGRGHPTVVAGVPPDYFSETGQRWGNPLYRWETMQADGFQWWAQRFERVFSLVDLVRLDHFRGFAAYWEIPAAEPTAVRGRWAQGPGPALFEQVQAKLGRLPLVAENLGVITDDVTELMQRCQLPGMAVMQFAFDEGPDHSFLPHNYRRALVAYTGTHDNDTLVGWWDGYTSPHGRAFARAYLGLDECREPVQWRFIRALLASVADVAVVPLQDMLGLGSEARMNVPGRGSGNWSWRLDPALLTDEVAHRLRTLTEVYGRAPGAARRY